MKQIEKFDIWICDLNPKKWHIQAWKRPCIIIQSNIFNKYLPITIVIPITSVIRSGFPSEIILTPSQINNLPKTSRILWNHIMTLDTTFLIKKIWVIDNHYKKDINDIIKIVLDIA